VGSARARALADAGYQTARDLLFHIPQRYEDRRDIRPVTAAAAGASFTFRGRLAGLRRIYTRRRGFTIVRGFLEDGSGRLSVMWLNRPYLTNQVAAGEEYVLHGAVREAKGGLELLNPSLDRADQDVPRIVPVYAAAGGVGSAGIGQGRPAPARVHASFPDGATWCARAEPGRPQRGLPVSGRGTRER